MNWGHKILIFYLVFVAGVLFFLYKATNEKIDLVTNDYYAEELKYQQKIDQTERSNALSVPVNLKIENENLIVVFPSDFKNKKIEGDILLYCPSDEGKDIKQTFSIQDSAFYLKLPASNKGLHEVKINWTVDGVSYYFEKKLMI